ncbi:hypothetical protein PIB30_093101, partial [Stylosanthes scabra]|nr:hypothetical protein [Stylosanthes scabra]
AAGVRVVTRGKGGCRGVRLRHWAIPVTQPVAATLAHLSASVCACGTGREIRHEQRLRHWFT